MLANLLRMSGRTMIPFRELKYTLNDPNPYGTSANDYFGYAVAISDNYVLVGAYGEDDASGTTSGKAYLYDLNTGLLKFTFNNPNPYGTSANDYFGYSVALTDSYAVVSAYQEDQAGYNNSGKVYIFDTSTGSLVRTISDPNAYGTPANDYFGNAVAAYGNYLVAGAYTEDVAGSTSSGKAYVFNITTGALVWTLNDPNPYGTSKDDYFGYNVAISNSYVLVGAYGEDDASGTTSGKAYIFSLATGDLLNTLSNPNAYGSSKDDNFGVSLGITDQYTVVSAYLEDDSGGSSSGKAYVFNTITGALLHILDNPNAYGTSSNDYFGVSTAISGNYIAIGAINEDDSSNSNTGKVYIFKANTGELIRTINNPNPYGTPDNDNFGNGVAICNGKLVVGSQNEDDASGTSSGKAFVFM